MQAPDWVSADGTSIALEAMTSAHIRAAMYYIQIGDGEHGPLLRPGCSGFTNTEWLQLMAAELACRARHGRE